MSDLRLELRLKNNLLYKAIFPRWDSVAAFVRDGKAAGHNIDQSFVGDLLRFKKSPRSRKTGELRSKAIAIAAFLERQPDHLFPDELYERVTTSSASMDLDSKHVLPNSEAVLKRLPAPQSDQPDADIEARDQNIERALSSLPFRLREVVKLRYGIPDGMEFTYEEIARVFNVTRERVRQMEAKAIRMLQHPARSDALEPYFDGRRYLTEDAGRGART